MSPISLLKHQELLWCIDSQIYSQHHPCLAFHSRVMATEFHRYFYYLDLANVGPVELVRAEVGNKKAAQWVQLNMLNFMSNFRLD